MQNDKTTNSIHYVKHYAKSNHCWFPACLSNTGNPRRNAWGQTECLGPSPLAEAGDAAPGLRLLWLWLFSQLTEALHTALS